MHIIKSSIFDNIQMKARVLILRRSQNFQRYLTCCIHMFDACRVTASRFVPRHMTSFRQFMIEHVTEAISVLVRMVHCLYRRYFFDAQYKSNYYTHL